MGLQTGTILLTIGGLFAFGALYAILVHWMRKKGWLEGFTAFMVVGGVVVTLVINKAVHHPNPALDLLMELACFAASGLPMVIEASFLDFAERRSRSERHIINQANEVAHHE